jgi:hypothetical protein
MNCPFCSRTFEKWEIDLWDAFACPKCHKWVRVRRNYVARIIRLFLFAGLTAVALYLAEMRGQRLTRAIEISVIPVAAVLEQAFLYLMPAHIESATPDQLDLA